MQRLRAVLWLKALLPSIFIHGTFDFTLFMSTMLGGDDLQPTLIAMAINVCLFLVSAVVWRKMWRRTLAKIALSASRSATALPARSPADIAISLDTPVASRWVHMHAPLRALARAPILFPVFEIEPRSSTHPLCARA
jgi:hypothetical protein